MIDLSTALPLGVARRLRKGLRRLHGRFALRIGAAARTSPLCTHFGFSRGTPIDRFYIERFLAAHRSDIRGRVLEIGDDAYSRRFGGEQISRQDVLHLDPDAAGLTITGDLAQAGVLPEAAFDCIILTQTLHLIYNLAAAIGQIRRSLRPGGVVLITVPGITSIDRGEWKDVWYWSLTERSLERLLGDVFDPGKVEVGSTGNLFAATAFLHGAALEEVAIAKLNHRDEAYPVIVTGRAVA
jgi:SAM-dependent methyltransferase